MTGLKAAGRRLWIKNWNIGAKTVASHLLIAFLAIMIASVLCYAFGYRYTRSMVSGELCRQVTVAAQIESFFDVNKRGTYKFVVDMYQDMTDSIVFFVDKEGESIKLKRYDADEDDSDSGFDEIDMSNYMTVELFDGLDKEFVQRILQGETVVAVEHIEFAGGTVIFAGAPVMNDDVVAGGIIFSQPIARMSTINQNLGVSFLTAAGISAVLAVMLAVMQSRGLVRPLQKMTRAARRMSEGDYGHRICISGSDEISELGQTLNTLSVQLSGVICSLNEERDRLKRIIGGIGEGIIAVDSDMKVVHYNRAFLELIEIDRICRLDEWERQDVMEMSRLLDRTIREGKNCEANWVNPSGRSIRAVSNALPNAQENLVGAVCLIADVSETLRFEQMRRDYVANVSHELRTPLTGIRGMIEPLMDGYVDTEEERQNCYSVIHKETIRLEKLVGEMLDMSRLQDGRITVELERMELPGILEAALHSMNAHANEGKVTLKLELDASALECMGNENRIMQVLIILLDNAIDFTPAGGVVTLFARTEAQQVVVGVRDTGCGIEPKDLPFIWERFYKADRSRMRTKGTGLGLSIAKLVVELMGGTISVKSEPGQGAEFVFTLNIPDSEDKV